MLLLRQHHNAPLHTLLPTNPLNPSDQSLHSTLDCTSMHSTPAMSSNVIPRPKHSSSSLLTPIYHPYTQSKLLQPLQHPFRTHTNPPQPTQQSPPPTIAPNTLPQYTHSRPQNHTIIRVHLHTTIPQPKICTSSITTLIYNSSKGNSTVSPAKAQRPSYRHRTVLCTPTPFLWQSYHQLSKPCQPCVHRPPLP